MGCDYCHHCDRLIDLDFDSNHFDEHRLDDKTEEETAAGRPEWDEAADWMMHEFGLSVDEVVGLDGKLVCAVVEKIEGLEKAIEGLLLQLEKEREKGL